MSQCTHKLTVGDITVSYYHYSNASGPYVLLLHGWEGNAGNMEAFVQSLIEQGFKIVAPNAPAHYNSSGNQCTLRDYQRVIVAMIQKFNPEIVISHSFGTAATILAMKEVEPQQIQKFVSISAPDRMIDIVSGFMSLLKLSQSQESAFLGYIEQQFELPFKEAEIHKILSGLSVDALIIHDENDKVVPIDNAHSITKANHRTRLFITKGYGHYRILWNQDLINTVTNFLLETKKQLVEYS